MAQKTGFIAIAVVAIVIIAVAAYLVTQPAAPPGEEEEPSEVTTYTLSTSVFPSGSGSVSPSSGTYDEGESITLTATPVSGYLFDHWGGDASGSINPITVTMDSNRVRVIVAYFTAAGIKIQIEVTSSTWRSGEPYDIYSAIKEKLENAGFEVVPRGSMDSDATLIVDYEERKGDEYSFIGEPIPFGYGTDIFCNLKLCDKTNNILFDENIFASTSYLVESWSLYGDAVNNFEYKAYFKNISEIIAEAMAETVTLSGTVTYADWTDGTVKLDAPYVEIDNSKSADTYYVSLGHKPSGHIYFVDRTVTIT